MSALKCDRCGVLFVISPSGMTCDCPRVCARPDTFAKLKKKYPKQISVSPADKDLQELLKEKNR